MSFKVPEKYRWTVGAMGSNSSIGNNGMFRVPIRGNIFKVIASDGMDWQHVSVSLPTRTPTWDEMCTIKDLFWDDEDCVVQFHPPKSEYVNDCGTCLHLWRPVDYVIETPPSILVGIKK